MLPYSRQLIEEDDIAAVAEAMRGPILTGGPKVREFEEALAAYLGVKYVAVLNSGTAALHAAYFAAGIGEGDEIVTSPITFVATANAALYLGADARFSDVGYDGNMAPGKLVLGEKTRAVVPVDYAGNPADLDAIRKQAGDALLIEDAAHALGSERNGEKVGRQAAMTIFSFHPVKPLTTIEGGAVATDDEGYYEKVVRFRQHGIVKKQFWNMEMTDLGYNYRFSDVSAALGLSQLKKLDRFIERRNEIADWYGEAFKGNPWFFTVPVKPENRSSRHLYPILLDRSLWCGKEEIFAALQEAGLGVQVHYKPVYQNPYYKERYGEQRLDVAEEFYRAELSIPCHQGMDENDMRKVKEALFSVLEKQSGKGCYR